VNVIVKGGNTLGTGIQLSVKANQGGNQANAINFRLPGTTPQTKTFPAGPGFTVSTFTITCLSNALAEFTGTISNVQGTAGTFSVGDMVDVVVGANSFSGPLGLTNTAWAVIQDLTRSTTYYQGPVPFPPPGGLAHPYGPPTGNVSSANGNTVYLVP
jgi:hypothetical protein